MYEWTGKSPSSGHEPEDGMRQAMIGLWMDGLAATIHYKGAKSHVVQGAFVVTT
jgi:hypothetical protein